MVDPSGGPDGLDFDDGNYVYDNNGWVTSVFDLSWTDGTSAWNFATTHLPNETYYGNYAHVVNGDASYSGYDSLLNSSGSSSEHLVGTVLDSRGHGAILTRSTLDFGWLNTTEFREDLGLSPPEVIQNTLYLQDVAYSYDIESGVYSNWRGYWGVVNLDSIIVAPIAVSEPGTFGLLLGGLLGATLIRRRSKGLTNPISTRRST